MKQLSKRQRDIVRLIGTANSPTTGIELANALNVSLRTIQNEIRTTLKKGGLLLGYNPRAPGSRLKARARTSSRPSAS